MTTDAVLGFRPHTYWTAVAAVGGSPDAPQVLFRGRFDFAGRAERFPYHRAAEGPPDAAPGVIEAARAASTDKALNEIKALLERLHADGVTVRLAATAAATAKLPPLGDILASHARIHTAEGDLFRDVVADACRRAGLEVRRVVERELVALVGDLVGGGADSAQARLNAMGAALGSPWNEDVKLAALAAWLQLGSLQTA